MVPKQLHTKSFAWKQEKAGMIEDEGSARNVGAGLASE
jgi:hypothetical protein